jgi:undecaprenyl diphosphate synthase
MDGYGRRDIAQAARCAAEDPMAGKTDPAAIDDTSLAWHGCLAERPPPDPLVHTGGARRIGHFLLWQAASAKSCSTNALWPDFGVAEPALAIADYAGRERRHGSAPLRAACVG